MNDHEVRAWYYDTWDADAERARADAERDAERERYLARWRATLGE